MNWETLVAIVVGVIVVGFVAAVWLARDPVSERVRIGVFLERNHRSKDDDPKLTERDRG